MESIQLFFLALLQGLTEFLPISSSAHLILPSQLLGWQDQGLAFDVAVHVGSLAAVVIYFRQRLAQLAVAWGRQLAGSARSSESDLAWLLMIATIPVGLAGLLGGDFIATHLRSDWVIATSTVVFGLLLGLADRFGAKQLVAISWRAALIIGLAQVLALIPGTSRSGITITAALLLGYRRAAAAEFSFLLSVPVIALSGLYLAFGLLTQGGVQWAVLLIGAAVSGLAAHICIALFMRWVERIGMWPFVIYRLLLGALLFILIAH